MFLGTVEPEVRSIVREHVRAWGVDRVWVGCSGNFTIERSLVDLVPNLHGDDVSIYTCSLGAYLSGRHVELAVKDESTEQLAWLEPYFDGGAGTVATMLLSTRFLSFVGKQGAYFERMVDGFRRQWDRMHEQTKAKVKAASEVFALTSFDPMDVREWLGEVVPGEGAVVSFPPFCRHRRI